MPIMDGYKATKPIKIEEFKEIITRQLNLAR